MPQKLQKYKYCTIFIRIIHHCVTSVGIRWCFNRHSLQWKSLKLLLELFRVMVTLYSKPEHYFKLWHWFHRFFLDCFPIANYYEPVFWPSKHIFKHTCSASSLWAPDLWFNVSNIVWVTGCQRSAEPGSCPVLLLSSTFGCWAFHWSSSRLRTCMDPDQPWIYPSHSL